MMQQQPLEVMSAWTEESFEEALKVARSLPKAEVHLHLDGSLLPDFVMARGEARGIEVPASAEGLRAMVDEMKGAMRKTSSDAREITRVAEKRNWPIFDWMNRFLQTADEVREATRTLAARLHDDEMVRYLEIRFCPALHCLEGLDPRGAVSAAVAGWRDAVAERPGLRGGLIVCALRSHPAPHPVDMAELAATEADVVGFDVAGAETFALDRPAILEALRYCKNNRVKVTAHAGELPLGMVPNLETALDLPVDRIGHGLALAYGDVQPEHSARLLKTAAEKDVVVEVCLTGICTKTRCPTYASHPIRKLIQAGIHVAIGCDNLTLSGDPAVAATYPLYQGFSYAYPSGEIAHLRADVGLSWAEIRTLILATVRAGFSPGARDPDFVAAFQADLDRAFATHGILFDDDDHDHQQALKQQAPPR